MASCSNPNQNIQAKVTHPLADNDVNFLDRKFKFLHLALVQVHNVVQPVCLDDFASFVDNIRHVNANDHFGTSLRGKHGQDARTASNIEHHLILKQVLGAENCIPVGQRAHTVIQHLIVNRIVTVGIKVVILGSLLFNNGHRNVVGRLVVVFGVGGGEHQKMSEKKTRRLPLNACLNQSSRSLVSSVEHERKLAREYASIFKHRYRSIGSECE